MNRQPRTLAVFLLGAVVLASTVVALRHYDSHDFIYSVWTPTRALSAGVDPYDVANTDYYKRYSVPIVAGLYVPSTLLLHAPLALLSASRSADVMAVLNAALIWLGVLLLIPPRTPRSCLVAALAGTAVIGSAAADHTIELGQLSGWAFAGLGLFVASTRDDSSGQWLPAVGAVLVSLKPQSAVPLLMGLGILGCWPVVKRAIAMLTVSSIPGVVLFLFATKNPVDVIGILVSNTQHMVRLPQANLEIWHNLRIDALGVVAHLGGPVLSGFGWAALTLVASTVAFAFAARIRGRDRPLAPTDPYVVTLLTLYVTVSTYHLTYDQLLLYVGPLAALGALIGERAPGSARPLAAGAVVLCGAGVLCRTVFRDQFADLGLPATLVHKVWVVSPTLICLALAASVLIAHGRREMRQSVLNRSAAARV